MKRRLQKYNIINLKTVTCIGFFSHCQIPPKLQHCLLLVHIKLFVWPSQIFCVFSSIFQHPEKVMKKSNDQWNHFFQIVDLTTWFVTWGQKKGGIYLMPWNPDKWLSPQRTHKVEYVSSFCWTKRLELVWNNGSGRGWILQSWTTTKASIPWVEVGQDDYIKEICSPEGFNFNPARL